MNTYTKEKELFLALHDKDDLQRTINDVIYLVTTNNEYIENFDHFKRCSLMSTLLQIATITLQEFDHYEANNPPEF
jgi:hypothetical protein